MGASIDKAEELKKQVQQYSDDKQSFWEANHTLESGCQTKEAASKVQTRIQDYTLGKKYSDNKAPIAQLFKQFPLSFEALAMRSKFGHEKYLEYDKDWKNWSRIPNGIEQYENAAARHQLNIGEDESPFQHKVAQIWNLIAALELTIENNNK